MIDSSGAEGDVGLLMSSKSDRRLRAFIAHRYSLLVWILHISKLTSADFAPAPHSDPWLSMVDRGKVGILDLG